MTSSLFSRPLIPLSLAFAAGIFTSHGVLPSYPPLILPAVAGAAAACLACVFSTRFRQPLLLLAFFLTGMALGCSANRTSALMSLAGQHRTLTMEGVVVEPAGAVGGNAKLRVRVQGCFADGAVLPIRDEDLMVTVFHSDPSVDALEPGQRIRFPARLRPFRNFNNPGRYDYRAAMTMKGYAGAAYVSDGRYVVPMGDASRSSAFHFLETARTAVRKFLETRLDPENHALFQALILGDRKGVGESLREPFIRSGLGHMLAVSGLHIGLIAWIAFGTIKWLLSLSYRLTLSIDIRRAAAVLACVPVVGYAFLSGFHVSSQRAMVMVLAFLGSLIVGREKETWSTLALAGLVVLALDPHALFSASFQLSFLAVIGILWLVPPLMDRFPRALVSGEGRGSWLNRVYTYALGLVVVSASAMVFLLPVTVHYFHRISLVAVPANVTALPILGLWVLPLGLLGTAMLPLWQAGAGAVLQVAAWGAEAMMGVVRFWAGLPGAALWTVTPSIPEILLFYGLLFFTFFALRTRSRWAFIGVAATLLLAMGDAGYWVHRVRFHRDLRVTFLDVGQGNAALIEFPGGKTMLIDGGGFPGDGFDVGRWVVAPALWHSKIGRIDTLVLSHPQADHMNGLRFIARAFDPETFWSNGDQARSAAYHELMDILEHQGVQKRFPRDLEDGGAINNVDIRLLHPLQGSAVPTDPETGEGLNDNSMVLKITYGVTSFLFTADLEKTGENLLLESSGNALESDILLVPHHGSRTSSSEALLRAVRPSLCIISCRDSGYSRFPHPSTTKRLEGLGCTVLRTDRSGAVTVTVHEGGFEVETYLDPASQTPINDTDSSQDGRAAF